MSVEKEETFYVVWNPTAGPPRARHNTEQKALSEAERLARSNPGQKFIVLGAIATIEAPPSIRIIRHNMEIPF